MGRLAESRLFGQIIGVVVIVGLLGGYWWWDSGKTRAVDVAITVAQPVGLSEAEAEAMRRSLLMVRFGDFRDTGRIGTDGVLRVFGEATFPADTEVLTAMACSAPNAEAGQTLGFQRIDAASEGFAGRGDAQSLVQQLDVDLRLGPVTQAELVLEDMENGRPPESTALDYIRRKRAPRTIGVVQSGRDLPVAALCIAELRAWEDGAYTRRGYEIGDYFAIEGGDLVQKAPARVRVTQTRSRYGPSWKELLSRQRIGRARIVVVGVSTEASGSVPFHAYADVDYSE